MFVCSFFHFSHIFLSCVYIEVLEKCQQKLRFELRKIPLIFDIFFLDKGDERMTKMTKWQNDKKMFPIEFYCATENIFRTRCLVLSRLISWASRGFEPIIIILTFLIDVFPIIPVAVPQLQKIETFLKNQNYIILYIISYHDFPTTNQSPNKAKKSSIVSKTWYIPWAFTEKYWKPLVDNINGNYHEVKVRVVEFQGV